MQWYDTMLHITWHYKLIIYSIISNILRFADSKNAVEIKVPPMKYIDLVEEDDLFFDRICFISDDTAVREGKDFYPLIVPGVVISDQHVLTTLNPLREIQHKESKIRDKIFVGFIVERWITDIPKRTFRYVLTTSRVECGRPVAYVNDDKLKDSQWHGLNKKLSPLHDLYVFRLKNQQKLCYWQHEEQHIYSIFRFGPPEGIISNVMKTELAKPGDSLNKTFIFASAGYKNEADIREWRQLHRTVYTADDDAIVDCDEWIPREWGNFICVLNIHNYPALGSGAILISDDILFGMGSFAIFKGKAGIFAFTDVRPYYDLIINTCTNEDDKFEETDRY